MKYLEVLQKCSLFAKISPEDLKSMLHCLDARERQYAAGESIMLAGEPAQAVGLVLEGRVQVALEGTGGERTLLTEARSGDIFAETFACALGAHKELPATVAAASDSVVLLMDYQRIITVCPSACVFHSRLIENMLAVLADKNLLLNRRLGHLSKRTTREKLFSYLREQAQLAGSQSFDIPFNRQELADYLCVERSAMSAVLSKLQAEGILETQRQHFVLKEDE